MVHGRGRVTLQTIPGCGLDMSARLIVPSLVEMNCTSHILSLLHINRLLLVSNVNFANELCTK